MVKNKVANQKLGGLLSIPIRSTSPSSKSSGLIDPPSPTRYPTLNYPLSVHLAMGSVSGIRFPDPNDQGMPWPPSVPSRSSAANDPLVEGPEHGRHPGTPWMDSRHSEAPPRLQGYTVGRRGFAESGLGVRSTLE